MIHVFARGLVAWVVFLDLVASCKTAPLNV